MGNKEIEEVIILACVGLGGITKDDIYTSWDFPSGVSKRIVVHAKPQTRGDYFYKGFVEVNIVFPDINGRADHEALKSAEQDVWEKFRYDTVGEYGGETYRYGLESERILYEEKSEYHYINTRLLFETLNI